MTKVRTAAKKKKENNLRAIIERQKQAAPAKQEEVKELDLSSSSQEITSLDKEQTKNTILFFKEELLAGIREGIDAELKSLDSETRQRLEASGLMKELYAGIKKGVTDELKKYIVNTNKSLIASFDTIVNTLARSIESLSQQPVIQTLPGEERPAIAPLERKEPITPSREMAPPLAPMGKQPVAIETLARKEQEEVATTILGREELPGQEPETRGGKIRNFLERATLGAVGLEDYAQKRIEKRQSLEYQVEIETKLDQKRFEGMSQKEIRKTVEREQLQHEEIKKKLSKNEAKVAQLRRAGYSDDDLEKLGVNTERENILKEAVNTQPSRLSKEYTTLAMSSKSSDVTTNETIDKNRTENVESTLVTRDELIRQQKESAEKSTTETSRLYANEMQQATSKDYSSTTSRVSDESQHEQTLKEEQIEKRQEEQVILLSEIREILKEAEKKRAETATAAGSGESSGVAMPDIDIDRVKSPTGRKPPTPKSAKPSALSRLGSLVRGPAGIFAAKAAAVGAAGYAGYKAGGWLNENVINPGIEAVTGGQETTLGGAIYSGVDKLQDMAGGWLGKSDKMKMQEAEQTAKIEMQKKKAAEQTINVKDGAVPPRTGDRLAMKMTDEKVEEKRPIVVNAPPPTVINNTGKQNVIMPPFTSGLRNNEPSISSYLKTRY